jgi:hypothetical protein
MRYEIDLFGVILPSLLLWAIVAYILTLDSRTIFARVGLYRHVWHRVLFDLSAYVCLLGGVVYLSKEFVS